MTDAIDRLLHDTMRHRWDADWLYATLHTVLSQCRPDVAAVQRCFGSATGQLADVGTLTEIHELYEQICTNYGARPGRDYAANAALYHLRDAGLIDANAPLEEFFWLRGQRRLADNASRD